jgi:hypothetical protein
VTAAKKVSHRQFLKLIGGAVGLAGVAGAATLPPVVEAAYSTGGAGDGGDLVNTHLTIQGNLTFSGGTNQRIRGAFNTASHAARLLFQGSAADQPSQVGVIPSGTGVFAAYLAYGASDPDNASYARLYTQRDVEVALESGKTGTGAYLPISVFAAGYIALRIDTSGKVGIGTSLPVEKLEVVGNIRLSGVLNVNGVVAIGSDGVAKQCYYAP